MIKFIDVWYTLILDKQKNVYHACPPYKTLAGGKARNLENTKNILKFRAFPLSHAP